MNLTTEITKDLYFCRLKKEELDNPYLGIRKFFDGESIEEVRERLEDLQQILLTEGYGELESNDKWFTVEFLKRIGVLIEASYIFHKLYEKQLKQDTNLKLA